MRCAEIGLTKELLEHLTVGTVYDMAIEKQNDNEDYPIKGTAEDIKMFFG